MVLGELTVRKTCNHDSRSLYQSGRQVNAQSWKFLTYPHLQLHHSLTSATEHSRILVDLMTLAHLHTTRATVPAQSNLLEGAGGAAAGGDKEWYYNVEKGDSVQRQGPVTAEQVDLYLDKKC